MSQNIFDKSNEVKDLWWKQQRVGDKIQGTFLLKKQVPDRMSQVPGTLQWLYEIKLSEPMIKNGEAVGYKDEIAVVGGKVGIDVQMRYVKPGQIIGMIYTGDKPSTKPGLSATKLVKVYANPTMVDTEWLAEQAEQAELETGEQGVVMPAEAAAVTAEIKETDNQIAANLLNEDSLMALYELAHTKILDLNPTNWKQKIMQITNLPVVPANLKIITDKLAVLPDVVKF